MPLVVEDVTPDPVLSFAATSAAGDPLWAQVFAGSCRVGRKREPGLRARLADNRAAIRLGFFVPGPGPLRPSYLLTAWGEMSLGTTMLPGGKAPFSGPFGVHEGAVELVDDGRGSGRLWAYLWFWAYGGEPMTVRYRVTVTQPQDR